MEKPDYIPFHMIPDLVDRLPAILRGMPPRDETVYLVGGALRDLLMGRVPSDYDLAVEGDAAVMAGRMARKTGAHLVVLGGERFRLHRLVLPGLTVDVESIEGADIQSDLARRDFTVNALAARLTPDAGPLLDPFDGRSDMAAGIIRALSDENLRADPLRMLRAYRFAASLDWRLAPETAGEISRHHALIRNVAPERVHEELSRILASGRADEAFMGMAASGLLFDLVPELARLVGLCQNPRYHAHDGWSHTLAVVRRLQEILNHPDSVMPADALTLVTALLTPEARGLLIWAALLHDVAKPVMGRPDPSGAPRFHGHDAEGGRMAAVICRRLRFSARHTGIVTDIVARHMRPLLLFQAHRRGELTRRGVMRFFRENEWKAPLITLHAVADALGKNGGDGTDEFVEFCRRLIREYVADYVPEAAKPPLMTGREIMSELNLRPSRLVGEILESLTAERLARPELTRSQALDIARNMAGLENRTRNVAARSGDETGNGPGHKKIPPEKGGMW